MIRKLLPIILALLGLGIGVGAGIFLRPVPEAEAVHVPEPLDPALTPEYVKMANQFVVPVLVKGKVSAMIILSLSLEVKKGMTAEVYDAEPKLRDTPQLCSTSSTLRANDCTSELLWLRHLAIIR